MVEKHFVVALAVDPRGPSLRAHLLCPLLGTSAEQRRWTCAAPGGTQARSVTHKGGQHIFRQLCDIFFCFPGQSCCRNCPLTNAVPVLRFPEGETLHVRCHEIKCREYLLRRKPKPGSRTIGGLNNNYNPDHCTQQQTAKTSQAPTS